MQLFIHSSRGFPPPDEPVLPDGSPPAAGGVPGLGAGGAGGSGGPGSGGGGGQAAGDGEGPGSHGAHRTIYPPRHTATKQPPPGGVLMICPAGPDPPQFAPDE